MSIFNDGFHGGGYSMIGEGITLQRASTHIAVREAALAAAAGGCSVIPINHQTKRPTISWERHQHVPLLREEITCLDEFKAFAVIAGSVSGGTDVDGTPLSLTCLDFDADAERMYHLWCQACGELVKGLPVQRTGGGGFQVIFKSVLRLPNEKFAYVQNPNEPSGREIAIESRGEGGYFVVAPSLHPSGNYYKWLEGDLATVPTLSQAHAEAIIAAAKRLNEAPLTRQQVEAQKLKEQKAKPRRFKTEAGGVGVIDAFNANTSIEDILSSYNYARKGERFIRPGGTSPSVVILDGCSFHHSSNDPLCDGHKHSPFSAFCYFEHHNDVKAAVRAAARDLGLDRVIETTEQAAALVAQPDAADPRVRIDAGLADATKFSPLCWEALKKAAGANPRLFKMGPVLMRLETGGGRPQLQELEENHMVFELHRAAIFTKTKGRNGHNETVVVHPPRDYARDLLADPSPPLPRLKRIVEAPVFAPDGTLQTQPGYHANSQTFFHCAKGLHVPPVSNTPSQEDVEAARDLLLLPLCDFPFVSESDRANALGFGLTSFVRDMIDGPTPLGGIEATGPGTGKGLLANIILYPCVGRDPGAFTLGKDENDTKNRVTTVLQSGKAGVVLDNVDRKVDSASLASVLTAIEWEDRKFITHELRSYPVRCVWLMTANNPERSLEIARRNVPIRLNAACEHPWERDGFKIPQLREWLKTYRGELIGAYLTLVRAWQCAGEPRAKKSLGSYEEWSGIVGGILENAGISGFLGNLTNFYQEANSEGVAWRGLVDEWHRQYGNEKVSTGQLYSICRDWESFDLNGKDDLARKKSLATKLRNKRDCIIGTFMLVDAGPDRTGTKCWRLKDQQGAGTAGSAGTFLEEGREKRSDESPSSKNTTVGEGCEKVPALPAVPARHMEVSEDEVEY